jgi:heme oxygenase (biliverdin-producing, ferredoxin)
MSQLKQLTQTVHHQAERMQFANKLLKGLEPVKYYRYLINQHAIYTALESAAADIIKDFPDIARSERIKSDIEELEVIYNLGSDSTWLCAVVDQYQTHVRTLDREGLLAHIYVRHFGDMYGGQMIKQRNPGSGSMYDFNDVEYLKQTVRSQLNDRMADEATRCFQFAIQLFKELEHE